jgi:transcriptional regulator with XRE-family HTH domain
VDKQVSSKELRRKRFIEELEQFRKVRVMSRKELAAFLGVPLRTLEDWYQRSTPLPARLEELAEKCRLSLLYIEGLHSCAGAAPRRSLVDIQRAYRELLHSPGRLFDYCARMAYEFAAFLRGSGVMAQYNCHLSYGPPQAGQIQIVCPLGEGQSFYVNFEGRMEQQELHAFLYRINEEELFSGPYCDALAWKIAARLKRGQQEARSHADARGRADRRLQEMLLRQQRTAQNT